MKKHLKLLSLAAALCGAVACSSSSGGTSSTTSGAGNTGTSGSGTGSPTASAAGSSTGGNTAGNTTGSSTGGTTTGAPPLTVYPCVDGGNAYQATTNLPAGITSCWCNPGIGIADPTDAGAQIVNGCPLAGSTPDTNIAQPPPAGTENLPLYDGGGFPQPPPGA